MAHTHHISTTGGLLTVQTFSNEFEERKFYSMVKNESETIFSQKLPENAGKTFSEVRSKVFDRLMYVYLSNELEGFENYDEPFSNKP